MDEPRLSRSDVELLMAARSDPQAFGEFYRRHAIGLERWLRTQRPRLAWATLARAPRLALATGSAGLAAATVAVVVLATAGAPPAYALTQNSNGTYTVTINDIATGVPALNARLEQLGIDTTAVPISATCNAPDDGVPLIGGWSSSTLSQTITLDQADIPVGYQGVIAAYQSPSGQIDLTIATTAGKIPSCLNANDISTATPSNSGLPRKH